MSTKRKPLRFGPVGLSCLTCRRRSKKCDKTRPVCERCEAGGFDCLGYDDDGRSSRKLDLERHMGVFRVERPTVYPASHDSTCAQSSDETTGTLSVRIESPDIIAPGALGTDGSGRSAESFGSKSSGTHSVVLASAVGPLDLSTPQLLQLSRTPASTESTPAQPGDRKTLNSVILCSQSEHQLVQLPSPRAFTAVPYGTRYIVDFIISQYERLAHQSYLRTNDWDMIRFRTSVANRLHGSDALRHIMFLAMKTLSAIMDGAGQSDLDGYTKCILRVEQKLESEPDPVLDSGNLSYLIGLLELNFLKLKIMRGLNSYQCIRTLAPMFLQIVFMDPSYWVDPWIFTSVSLTRVLTSGRYELSHFVLLDSMYSLAYVTPQAIEYDTSILPNTMGLHPTEWIHGCPVEFQHALVEINAYYHAQYPARPSCDWRAIEHRVRSWIPKIWSTTEEEPQKTIARLGVQESWRHTVLIYLYMAMCGVTSDDERVQASVTQVFKLGKLLRNSPLVSIYLPIQYLVAGACARTEKHRDFARELLEDTRKDPIRLLNAVDFVAVLNHLWQGAAANGKPIRWSNYAHSRSTVLPIVVGSETSERTG